MSGVLKAIQASVADRLLSDPYFENIPVITENIGDIETAIDEAVDRLGICMVVVTPGARVTNPNVAGPWFNKIPIVVRAIENVILNRGTEGAKQASEAVEMAAILLHLHTPTEHNDLLVVDEQAITIVPVPKVKSQEGWVSYELLLWSNAQIKIDPPSQVAAPALTNTAGEISMTCATGGAALFYTTDGKFPMPRGTTATLYTAPFTPGPGKTVRARAWLAGYAPSELASLTT